MKKGENMKKYLCKLCGYIYNPEENDDVEFFDLPVDWVCPLCQASKDEFEEIFTSTGATIFVYNSEEDELYEGSLGDLHTYKVYRDNCSTVFYYAVSGEVRNFIIYN